MDYEFNGYEGLDKNLLCIWNHGFVLNTRKKPVFMVDIDEKSLEAMALAANTPQEA